MSETDTSDTSGSGETHAAGEGLSDEEMARQVAETSPSEEEYADVSKREADGITTETEIAKADADEVAGD